MAVATSSRLTLWIGTAIVLAAIGSGLLLLVHAHGLCCYDDASFAVVAKNLAEGRGYILPFRYSGSGPFAPRAFDPLLGTGPVSILPVATAIALFGPKYWVPGATHVALELLLLGFATYLLARVHSAPRVLLFLIGSLLVIGLLSAKSLAYWSAQLGETIAALLILCGFLAWSTRGPSVAAAALTGLLLGLAVLTKELAGIYVLGFLAVVITQRIRQRRIRPLGRDDAEIVIALAISGLAPFALFELWRLFTLGIRGFYWNWLEHLAFIKTQSARPQSWPELVQFVVDRSETVEGHFFIGLPIAIAISAFNLYLTRFQPRPPAAGTARLLAWGVMLNSIHWVLFSNGSPRYLYIAVVLWGFLLAMPLLTATVWRPALAYLATLGFAAALALPHFELFATARAAATGALSPPNEPERRTLEYLDRHTDREAIYTSWWAHIAALEYFSAIPGRFQGAALKMLASGGRPIYVVMNTRLAEQFRLGGDLALMSRLEECGHPVFSSKPYLIFYCART